MIPLLVNSVGGTADRRRTPWFRNVPDPAMVWQTAGIGGSTLHYYANCPRAFPSAIDNEWPIHYKDLIPYYEKVEATLPVNLPQLHLKRHSSIMDQKRRAFLLIEHWT